MGVNGNLQVGLWDEAPPTDPTSPSCDDSASAENGSPPVLLRGLEYVVVDVETTGGPAGRGHRITEVAAVRVDGQGRALEEFRTLINPERPIPPLITRLTNITDGMVREAPRFEEIAPELLRLLDDAVFVAHSAHFDWGFLEAELERVTGRRLEGRRLCTVRLSRRVVPEVSSRSLDALCFYFGIENEARHRAWGDARATVGLFARLFERLDEREVDSWDGLEALLQPRPRRRKKRRAMPGPMDET